MISARNGLSLALLGDISGTGNGMTTAIQTPGRVHTDFLLRVLFCHCCLKQPAKAQTENPQSKLTIESSLTRQTLPQWVRWSNRGRFLTSPLGPHIHVCRQAYMPAHMCTNMYANTHVHIPHMYTYGKNKKTSKKEVCRVTDSKV